MQARVLFFFICFVSIFTFSAKASSGTDSVGVENSNGKKTILHKVTSRETYYAISRRYNVSPQAIMDANNIKVLQPGMLLKVPTDIPFTETQKITITTTTTPAAQPVAEPAAAASTITEYRVSPRETLFAIARKFNSTVDDIKSLNKLNGNTLSAGQIIKVRYGVATNGSMPAVMPTTNNLPQNSDSTIADTGANASDRLKLPPVRYGLRELTEHGVAASITDESMDGTKMLALHRTAPIGTVIKITNPMSNKSTFAKVVGKFTDNESTRDVIIVITKAAATHLGALDKRFQVNLVYGVPSE